MIFWEVAAYPREFYKIYQVVVHIREFVGDILILQGRKRAYIKYY
jgi:sulfur relay (sulfurtransferase) DsrC/TusE family protein